MPGMVTVFVPRETSAVSLGADAVAQLADLLGEFWVAVLGSGLLPSETTLGIGKV